MSRQAPFRHVYHLGRARLFVLPAIWALFALLLGVGAATGTAEESRAMLLTLAIFTVIFLPFFAIAWQSRLVLTHEGIAHHQFGYTVRSSWQNLKALTLAPGAEALYLVEPGTRSMLLRLSARMVGGAAPSAAHGVVGDPNALAEGRLIFLAPFMAHWQRGPLREDILRCAPQLAAAASPTHVR